VAQQYPGRPSLVHQPGHSSDCFGVAEALEVVLALEEFAPCAGYTNAEIGAKLFISAKTIDHHVSAVLGKLGASTRQAADSQAARLRLASAAEI
jgi:hypothetical protein